MYRTLRTLVAALLLALPLVGCNPPAEKEDKKADHLDAESLKVLKNPPPGVPGAPPGAQQVPGAPQGAATAPGK